MFLDTKSHEICSEYFTVLSNCSWSKNIIVCKTYNIIN